MIIWGWSGQSLDLGEIEKKQCPVCEKERSFHIYLEYTFNHFWYIFGYSTGKKYISACEICHRGEQLDTKATESRFVKSPIPVMHRYGCLVGIAGWIVLMLIIAGMIALFDIK